MKKKRIIVLLVAVVVICALGVVASNYFEWNVDRSETSGDIAKSARFSRKAVADVNSSNFQELLVNDESFKKNMVAAFVVMQSRVKQFNSLVNMSVDVAGNKPSFDKILAEMKAAKPMLDNVNSSMSTAGSDLNAVLGGENRKELAQNTNNATLAYATLQKQNNLADKFIQATDEYLKKSTGGDESLKLVRDQWLEYQIISSALNKDEETQKELEEKGYLLSSEQAALTLKEMGGPDMTTLLGSTFIDGLVVGETPGAGHVCIRFGELDGLLSEMNQGGLLSEINQGGLLSESNQGGLLSEMNQGGLLSEMNQGGLLSESNQGGLLSESNQGGLLSEINQGGLLSEINQGGLLGFVGGSLLKEAFGDVVESFGFANQGQLLSEFSGPGLLSEIDLGGVLSALATGDAYLRATNSGGLAQ